jgi:putative iron-dependent peroxidase
MARLPFFFRTPFLQEVFMSAQSAILPAASPHARFLVLKRAGLTLTALRAALDRFAVTRRRLQAQEPEAGLTTAVGFGPALWRELHGRAPEGLHDLAPIAGSVAMPAAPGDLFLHIHSHRLDFCFELALSFMQDVAGQVEVLEEVAGFRYLDSRDLTGFIDGTENPQLPEGRAAAALIPEGEFAGGSFAFAQRYVHNLEKWHQLKVEAQEHVIGRSKLESIELDDEVRPENSHVSRTVVEEDGEELEILRHSLPYGATGGERGLFFLAYTRDLSIIDRMLARMFGTAGDGLSDRLLNFVTPVGGAYFFVPPEAMLRAIAEAE